MAPAGLDVGLTGRTSSRGLIGATIRAEVHHALGRQNAGAPSAVTGDVFRKSVIQQRLDFGKSGLMDYGCLDSGCLDCPGWREGKLWSRLQRFSHGPGSKAHDRIFMELQQAQVGIGASHLRCEQLLNVFRLGNREAALAGTELHESELVILAAVELKRATVGPVRNDRVPDICQRQGTFQPGRVTRGQVSNELPEESLQVVQLPSRDLRYPARGNSSPAARRRWSTSKSESGS